VPARGMRLPSGLASESGTGASLSRAWVPACVRKSGLTVACVGGQLGWMFADGADRARLLAAMNESYRWAQALGARTVMSPADTGEGDLARAAAAVREVGDMGAAHGVRIALEAPSQAAQLNTIERLREVIARAGHPSCGLLVDAYHLHRGGGGLRAVEELSSDDIAYVQYSDVPASGLQPGQTLDRLPPGPYRTAGLLNKAIKIPEGEVYVRTENPLGVQGYYVVGNGKKEPYRLKMRTASFSNISVLPAILPGTLVPDLIAILGSIFFVVGDVDK